MTEDKQIRLKQKLLQGVTPQHFGVSTYLLLNDQTPILEIANERDALLQKVDLRLSRHTVQRHNTLANIFLNSDLSKEELEQDLSTDFNPPQLNNLMIQNKSTVTIKD